MTIPIRPVRGRDRHAGKAASDIMTASLDSVVNASANNRKVDQCWDQTAARHAIATSKTDPADGERIARGRRVSVTQRTLAN
ncbi:hypothetical protein ACFFX1_11805 [Dactylosporangium sucinum]|nr:hypothetical protein [Dactylosporangium sucinum]